MRDIFKKRTKNGKINQLIDKYNIPREYLSINRKSISRGIGLGIFIGFIPMPFQMLAVLAFIPLLRFNVPIAIAMVWLSNPITMPPMYYMEYETGLYFMGQEALPNIELTLEWFETNFEEILVPLYIGTIFYSVSGSILAYLLINILWIRSIHEYKRLRRVRNWINLAKRYQRFQENREAIVTLQYDHRQGLNHILDDTLDKMRLKVKYNKQFVHLAHRYRDIKRMQARNLHIKDHLKDIHMPHFKNPLSKEESSDKESSKDQP